MSLRSFSAETDEGGGTTGSASGDSGEVLYPVITCAVFCLSHFMVSLETLSLRAAVGRRFEYFHFVVPRKPQEKFSNFFYSTSCYFISSGS